MNIPEGLSGTLTFPVEHSDLMEKFLKGWVEGGFPKADQYRIDAADYGRAIQLTVVRDAFAACQRLDVFQLKQMRFPEHAIGAVVEALGHGFRCRGGEVPPADSPGLEELCSEAGELTSSLAGRYHR